MKIKTSELSGAALDWAVAKCEGMKTWPKYPAFMWDGYAPSTDWSQAGPIIERECICLDYWNEDDPWKADMSGDNEQFGDTPLTAAMRCYVASKLGDTVDVPDELV